jgi:hypothetical protein
MGDLVKSRQASLNVRFRPAGTQGPVAETGARNVAESRENSAMEEGGHPIPGADD